MLVVLLDNIKHKIMLHLLNVTRKQNVPLVNIRVIPQVHLLTGYVQIVMTENIKAKMNTMVLQHAQIGQNAVLVRREHLQVKQPIVYVVAVQQTSIKAKTVLKGHTDVKRNHFIMSV